MAIEEGEWRSIRALVQRMFSTRAEQFFTGKVTKSDRNNFLVYLNEFGQQPIPMVIQEFEVTYYDTQYTLSAGVLSSKSVKKQAKVKVKVPSVGSTVVVAREWGTARIPRCMGRLVGKNWIKTGTD